MPVVEIIKGKKYGAKFYYRDEDGTGKFLIKSVMRKVGYKVQKINLMSVWKQLTKLMFSLPLIG